MRESLSSELWLSSLALSLGRGTAKTLVRNQDPQVLLLDLSPDFLLLIPFSFPSIGLFGLSLLKVDQRKKGNSVFIHGFQKRGRISKEESDIEHFLDPRVLGASAQDKTKSPKTRQTKKQNKMKKYKTRSCYRNHDNSNV